MLTKVYNANMAIASTMTEFIPTITIPTMEYEKLLQTSATSTSSHTATTYANIGVASLVSSSAPWVLDLGVLLI